MLKLLFKRDEAYITKLLNDIVNDRIKDVEIFSEMVVIPIYSQIFTGSKLNIENSYPLSSNYSTVAVEFETLQTNSITVEKRLKD